MAIENAGSATVRPTERAILHNACSDAREIQEQVDARLGEQRDMVGGDGAEGMCLKPMAVVGGTLPMFALGVCAVSEEQGKRDSHMSEPEG